MAYDHLGQQLVLADGSEGLFVAKVDIASLRAHRATDFGMALRPRKLHPELCVLPRLPGYGGTGALGRMSAPL